MTACTHGGYSRVKIHLSNKIRYLVGSSEFDCLQPDWGIKHRNTRRPAIQKEG